MTQSRSHLSAHLVVFQSYMSIALIAALLIRLRFFFLIRLFGGIGRTGGLGPAGAGASFVVVVDVVVSVGFTVMKKKMK